MAESFQHVDVGVQFREPVLQVLVGQQRLAEGVALLQEVLGLAPAPCDVRDAGADQPLILNCAICCWKPRNDSPIVLLTGTRTSSNTSSAVSLDQRLSSILRPTLNPGVAVGTRICDIPA